MKCIQQKLLNWKKLFYIDGGHAQSSIYVLSSVAFHSLCFERSPFYKIDYFSNAIASKIVFVFSSSICWMEKWAPSSIKCEIVIIFNWLSPRFLQHFETLWYWIIIIILNESWWLPLSYEQNKITSQSTVRTGHLITQTLNDSNSNEKWLWLQQQFHSQHVTCITNHC